MNPRYPPRADVEYDKPADGFPQAACVVCGRSPCAIRVRWWETAHTPISPTRFVRAGRSETHFFCLAHGAASEHVYVRFTARKQKRAAP